MPSHNDLSKKKKRRVSNPNSRKRARLHEKESATTHIDEIVQLSLEEKCNLIAELSESILENPTGAFRVNKDDECEESVSKMRRLLEISNILKNGNDAYIARLGLLSLLAIFQDILPSYRIRLPTAAEMTVRVTKETKATWDYERALLSHYQQYLKLLERTWDRRSKNHHSGENELTEALAVSALLCLCELFKCAYHFNFHSNIASLVVRNMNHAGIEEVRVHCCNAVRYVFANDTQGEVALETTRLVAKLVRDGIKSSFSVRPDVLRTFVALPLRVHVDEAQVAKLAASAKAKKRKSDKALSDIQDEMQEGSATVDKIVLAQSQASMLEAVVLVYFYVLKSDDEQVQSNLLSPTLEGLAKFAHLINIDTVVDVLAVLKKLLQNVDTLPLDGALNCVLTAFQTLQGPGSEMKIDQKEYVTPLYSQLPRLCFENRYLDVQNDDQQQHVTDLALKCLNAAFMKRREYSMVRVASFVKRLCSIALLAPNHTSAPLLAFARQLFQRYPSISALLENEQDIVTSGVYDATVQDPEHANPFATCSWELSLLKFHVHPIVSSQAASIGAAATAATTLQTTPSRLRTEMIRNAKEIYIEYLRSTKKHPLATSTAQANKSRRQQVRFLRSKRQVPVFLKEQN